MIIEKIKVINYKIFKEKVIELNDNVNIFVGENDAGNSLKQELETLRNNRIEEDEDEEEEINNNVNKSTILPDIGTGGGEKFINNISNDCLLKIGTDFSDEMIKVSKRNIEDRINIKVLKMDSDKLLFLIK